MTESNLGERLWRVRKRHDHIDAVIEFEPSASVWRLHYLRNDKRLVSWPYDTRDAAAGDADVRLRELQRAGWATHW